MTKRQLYAEHNPDYFLEGFTYTPEEQKTLKNLSKDPEKRREYKISIAKQRATINRYKDKTASKEYDDS